MPTMPRGRPPQDGEKRTAKIEVKCHAHQRDAWRAAAGAAGVTLSEWVRARLEAAAKRRR